MGKASRRRATRRDRRKAKASGYARLPKKFGVVGHGTALGFDHTSGLAVREDKDPREPEPTRKPLTVPLQEAAGVTPVVVTKLPYIEPAWAREVEPLRIRGGRTGGKSRPISLQDQVKKKP